MSNTTSYDGHDARPMNSLSCDESEVDGTENIFSVYKTKKDIHLEFKVCTSIQYLFDDLKIKLSFGIA